MSYVPLWCKSNYSFLEGASHPAELISRACDLGLPAIALTDRDGVYGVVRAYTAAKERSIHLIIGSEMTVDDDSRVVLLVKNRAGYANLCELISRGRLRSEKGSSHVSWEEICEAHEGVIALLATGCERVDGAILGKVRRTYGTDVAFILPQHIEADDPYRRFSVCDSATSARIPLVAATEVLYHDRRRKPLHDICTCISHGITLDEAGAKLAVNSEHDLKSATRFARLYRDFPQAVALSAELARRCTFTLEELQYRYPSELLPAGFTSAQRLEQLAFKGAGKRYPSGVPAPVRRQLAKELDLIDELDYCGYFLTMWDIVQYCKREHILCQGRGSAANSVVCFCLGITAIDPVRMDLLFERFISRERAEPPDIDLDIEHRRREEVIQHMYEKYGRERAAMVANVVRYRTRSAVKDVGKALGIPAASLDKLARLISVRGESPAVMAKEAETSISSDTIDQLMHFAEEIHDFPRHLSIHPGGFLLGSEPVSRIVPIENATMPGRTVIQWDKYDVEELGLFKVDLLGLGALTHLAFAFDLSRRYLGENLSMATVPAKDGKVFDMLAESDTVGVFQLESRAQMSMLARLKPRTYYDIVIQISIVRPGPIAGGMVHPYLRRRNGEEPLSYPHPSLEPVLRKTLGVPLFQEQVMKLAVVAAGYTPGEADQLRRDMAAWRRQGTIERHHERLVDGMLRRGISEEFAEQVFQQIRGFGEYGFPESHAASFALITYSTAWFRARLPVVFVCSLLNAWPMGFYSPATIVEDGRRHGMVILPVCVVASEWECTLVELKGEQRIESMRTLKTKDASFGIRMGMRFVKGLGKVQFERIQRTRDPGFKSFDAFRRLTALPEDVLVTLSESGACRAFSGSRRGAIWNSLEKQRPGAGDELPYTQRAAPEFQELTAADVISWDHASMHHSTCGHPIEPYRNELSRAFFPDAGEVLESASGVNLQYAGLVICRQRPETASGTLFLTLEDETGFVNCILWSRTFERYRTLVLTSTVLAVSGKVQKEGKVVHIIVDRCWVPELSSEHISTTSRDFH